MSVFYGNVRGSRGEATRCGSSSSGIMAAARSWHGSITVHLGDDTEKPTVTISVSDGSAVGGKCLYQGPLYDLLTADRLTPEVEIPEPPVVVAQ